jgi:leader peptidase (prepilin peptidase) / N-methyltransferase
MPSGSLLLALEVKPVWCGFAFLVGLVVGSFANVCIHRLPRGMSVVSPPSRCPGCASRIAPWDNLPLFSYLLLGGRCRSCRTPISIRYPGVEALNGLMYAGLALRQGPTAGALVSMAFVTALLVLALIDLEWHILPNVITRPGIVVGVLASTWANVPTPLGSWLQHQLCPRLCLTAPRFESLAAALLGYSSVAAITGLAWLYYRLVRKEDVEPMGQGDWKLMAMIGAFRGTQGMWTGGFLGTLFGSLFGIALLLTRRGTGRTPIPLGTFLCAGAALELFAGAQLLAWYRGLFGFP